MSWVRKSHRPASNISVLTTKVAQAHPTTPMPDKPAMPKVRAYDSGTLTSKAPACNQVTKRGCPKLWLSVLNMRNSKDGNKASARMRK